MFGIWMYEMVFVKFTGCALNVRMCHVDVVIHSLYGRTFSCTRLSILKPR